MAYFHSTPYYPYSTNTTVPTSSPFYPSYTTPYYSSHTPITTQSPSWSFNRAVIAPIPTPSHYTYSAEQYPQQPTLHQPPNHTPIFNHRYTPPTPTPSPSPSPNPYIISLSPQTPTPSLSTATIHNPFSLLEMKLSIFDGSDDAYWWIICSEKSFNSRNQRVSDAERLMECGFAMKGSALTWWLSWYLANPNGSWDSFTSALLWHFKPEWRPILPIEGEKEETEFTISVEEEESTKEENTEFIALVNEEKPTVAKEPKTLVIGSDFFSMTNQNLEIIETKHKEKEQDSKTHHDSLPIFLCSKPPPPRFPSTMLSSEPPLKPPDLQISPPPPPVLPRPHPKTGEQLIEIQSAEITSNGKWKKSSNIQSENKSDENHITNLGFTPPENITPASSPPPKPPDRVLIRFTRTANCPSSSIYTEPVFIFDPGENFPVVGCSVSSSENLFIAAMGLNKEDTKRVIWELQLPDTPIDPIQYQSLDPNLVKVATSHPLVESTISVKFYCPIMHQHVAMLISDIPSTHSQPEFPPHQVTLAAPILLSPSDWPLASKNSTIITIEALMVIPYFHAQNMCLPDTCMNSKYTSYYYVPSTNFNAWDTNSTHEIVGLLMGQVMLSLFISQRHINGQWKDGVQSTTSFLPFKQWDPGKK